MELHGKRIITTISLFSTLAMLPMSCGLFCNDSCGCGPVTKPREFVIESFATKTVDELGNNIPETQSRNYNQIFKSVEISDRKFTSKAKVEGSMPLSLGLAFACSPAPDTSTNELQLIEIINEVGFTVGDGTEYEVGENLNSLFGISEVFRTNLVPIEEYPQFGAKLTLDDFFKIGLFQNPGKELQLEFTIRIVFDDAQQFLLTNQTLNVR
jgi:hypothetical protein